MNTRRLSVALALVVFAASWGSTPEPTRAAGIACKDVMFIGARGSGELASTGMGVPVTHMARRLGKAVATYGETMGTLAVPYAADSVDELVPSKAEIAAMAASGVIGLGNPVAGVAGLTGAAALYYTHHARPYLESIKDGVRRTIQAVEAQLSLCPESELVLAGYSQGAMAVHQAELQMKHEGKDELLDAIGGTLLLGDGDRVPHSAAKLIGGASSSGEGVQVALHGFKPRDVAEPETTVEICVPGDIVCDFRLRTDAGALAAYRSGSRLHSGYKDKPQSVYLDRAVDWLAREIGLSPSFRIAGATSRRRTTISFRGINGLRWGSKLTRLEKRLGVSFDCSEGLTPGRCLCPPSEPDLSILFVFDLQGPRHARLQAFTAYGGPVRTARGISIGSSKGAVERAYPGARYEVNAPLTSGLSTFLIARHNGHALVFPLRTGHVTSISAFARGGNDNISSEQCA